MTTTRGVLAPVVIAAALASATGVAAQAPTEEPAEAAAVPAPDTPPPVAPPTLSDAIAGGKLILEARLRYEGVDQTKTAILREDGEALTLRTRLGSETGAWNGLRGLVEFEDVRQVGSGRFSGNVSGAATPPLNGADKVRF